MASRGFAVIYTSARSQVSYCFPPLKKKKKKKTQKASIMTFLCLAGGDFCHLLITFANSRDPDHEWQEVTKVVSKLFDTV